MSCYWDDNFDVLDSTKWTVIANGMGVSNGHLINLTTTGIIKGAYNILTNFSVQADFYMPTDKNYSRMDMIYSTGWLVFINKTYSSGIHYRILQKIDETTVALHTVYPAEEFVNFKLKLELVGTTLTASLYADSTGWISAGTAEVPAGKYIQLQILKDLPNTAYIDNFVFNSGCPVSVRSVSQPRRIEVVYPEGSGRVSFPRRLEVAYPEGNGKVSFPRELEVAYPF